MKDDGFTLVEVLVAFAILAGAIVMSFQIFGDGLRQLKLAQSRALEIDVARQELTSFVGGENASGDYKTGVTQGISWVIRSEQLTENLTSGQPVKVGFFIMRDRKDVLVLETIALRSRPQ
jgi:prepilin-type N-terminal cleavage/methylation domain-containing protein